MSSARTWKTTVAALALLKLRERNQGENFISFTRGLTADTLPDDGWARYI